MKDMGNWWKSQLEDRIVTRAFPAGPEGAGKEEGKAETYENDCDDGKDQESDILLLVVLALFHGLPRLYDGDLLLFQRDEVVQLGRVRGAGDGGARWIF